MENKTEDPDDLWGNEYGSPMYWIPPDGDEYWELIKDKTTEDGRFKDWDEDKYWKDRIIKENSNG